jgi:hypothetical protein
VNLWQFAGLAFAGACAVRSLPAVSPIKTRNDLANTGWRNILFSEGPDVAPVFFRYVLRGW